MSQNCCQTPTEPKPRTAKDVADEIFFLKGFGTSLTLSAIAFSLTLLFLVNRGIQFQEGLNAWNIHIFPGILLLLGLVGLYAGVIAVPKDLAKAEAEDQAREQKRIARAGGI